MPAHAHHGSQHLGGGLKGIKGSLHGSKHSLVAGSKMKVGSLHLGAEEGGRAREAKGGDQGGPRQGEEVQLLLRAHVWALASGARMVRAWDLEAAPPPDPPACPPRCRNDCSSQYSCCLGPQPWLVQPPAPRMLPVQATGIPVPSLDADEHAIHSGLHSHPRHLAGGSIRAFPRDAQLPVRRRHIAARVTRGGT